MTWELDLLDHLDGLGFTVPTCLAADDGRRLAGGVIVQRWIDGHAPSSDTDWHRVAEALHTLHAATRGYPQRPDCVAVTELGTARRSVDADLDALPSTIADELTAVFGEFAGDEQSVVHGDPGPGNIRIAADGTVGLIDWDESRVDVSLHDLSNLGVAVLDRPAQRRAERLSNAWEAANGWTAEPRYAHSRLAALRRND